MNRDISDSLQAQEELRRSEERLAKIFRSSPAGITISRRRDGHFLEANDAYLKMVGYTREQIIGRTSVELGILSPEGRAELLAAVAAHGYVHSVDLQLVSAAGTVADLLCSIEEIDYDGEPCLLIHSFDITARKRLERELRASEQNYRLLADNSPDVIFQTDAAARLTYISPSIERLTGYTPAEILEMPFDALLAPPSMELLRVRRPQILALARARLGPPFSNYAFEQRRKDGSTFWVEAVARAQYDGTGVLTGFVGILRDITDQIRYQQLLENANANLEQRVLERTVDLQAALDALKQANQLKDEFMAMISHELRTPLTGILSLSQMLTEQVIGPLNDRQVYYVKGIEQSGERLLNIVNEILNYTHLISGKVQLRPAPCDLAALLTACAGSQQREASAKGQTITVRVEPDLLTIISDGTALADVIKRLLDNAIKFTPKGGQVGLEAHFTPEAVDGPPGPKAKPGANAASVDLVVWDTGVGIDQAELAHLVKPFTQVDARLARSHEGIGLGLATVHQMVGLLGGTLAVQSAVGQGSRFTITLPVGQL